MVCDEERYTNKVTKYWLDNIRRMRRLTWFDWNTGNYEPVMLKSDIRTAALNNLEVLKSLIEQLPVIQRAIIYWHYVDRDPHTIQDICQRLSLSQATVHYQQRKALDKLTEQLNAYKESSRGDDGN